MPAPARLLKRSEFLRVSAEARKWGTPNFTLLARQRIPTEGAPRVGFTVTKKVGNAVVRNRVRRRLREAVRLAGGETAKEGWDYVLIARNNALHSEFAAVLRDVHLAFARVLGAKIESRPPRKP